jgi:Lamin Tail Domain/Calx-beta domain/Domain of unknown function (DUF4214)
MYRFPRLHRRLTSVSSRQLLVVLTAALIVLLCVVLPALPARAVSSTVVISEFRVRGPNGGNDEFVELYNLSPSPVAVGGWKLQASNGSGVVSTRVTINSGVTLQPGCHYLMTNSSTSGGPYSGAVAGDQTYSTGITDDGGLALTLPDGTVVDQVGLSGGSAFKEGAPLASLGTSDSNRSYERKPGGAAGSGTDTDNNAGDFQLISPSDPQNSSGCIGPPPSPTPCGIERWSVKTGTDASAGLIDLSSAAPTTVATMRGWPKPADLPDNSRISPYETTLWVVNATLAQYKREEDLDYHLVLRDEAGNTMIAEVAQPSCVAAGDAFAARIADARAKFDARLPDATTTFKTADLPVQVTGVGFFDILHGQTGVAPNGVELHPVLDISFPQSAPTPLPQRAVQFASSARSANESDGGVNVTVNRVGDVGEAATVFYETVSHSASDRSDYTTALGTLRFAPGEQSKMLRVFITDDAFVEPPETFDLVLSGPTGAALGTPAVTTLTINSDDANTPGNPADQAQFFVRQHYVDFLNREPDAAGLQFWVNNIEGCGADANCREVKRINVSAAFFLSIEFQETGYLVYRLHQAAFDTGETLRLRTFLLDTQEIGRGVVVNQGDWRAQLEANKQAFVAQFVTRPEFVAAFTSSLTAAQYVDALNSHTTDPLQPSSGGSLTQSERDQLVSDLSAGRKTRADVLRAVAENDVFRGRQSNKGFVYMQYVGYLRRNPNDSPDADFAGYNFWLSKLNEFHGNFVNAEMVKAFITSLEYRGRFGP